MPLPLATLLDELKRGRTGREALAQPSCQPPPHSPTLTVLDAHGNDQAQKQKHHKEGDGTAHQLEVDPGAQATQQGATAFPEAHLDGRRKAREAETKRRGEGTG